MRAIKLGLPKGSLQEATFRMFKKAGFSLSVSERSYFPSIDDEQIKAVLLRAQEIPAYVENGVLDCGITGADWVLENNAKVEVVDDLLYAKQRLSPVRWVLAVPYNSRIKKVRDLQGKRIATELVNVTKKYLKKHKVRVDVEFSWGATEAKVPQLVDAIVELTETGSSLRAHNLQIIDTVCESTTQLIANPRAWKDAWRRNKIQNIALLLKGAIGAEEKVGLKLNVQEKNFKKVLSLLPAMKNPTISHLSRTGWFAVEIVADEKVVRSLIPALKKAGAEAIIEYNLTKVIP
ncbi:MAG: ATP phosphoribosyltransferase [Candidatus Omnitrophica bacterium]|nr:ATP phosphoribosyltransferase [Candidatus Omnitrophota bacterium]MBU1924666.1 ATP phosphoribosyltransferase [Candidatus Omnitrophota bacterium]MBU2063714.1 ATP phosphoribosyltransferase [Candidatus Omnitrophota bacterium]